MAEERLVVVALKLSEKPLGLTSDRRASLVRPSPRSAESEGRKEQEIEKGPEFWFSRPCRSVSGPGYLVELGPERKNVFGDGSVKPVEAGGYLFGGRERDSRWWSASVTWRRSWRGSRW